MTEIKEHDAMICRACGKEERASEGYPCQECGTFICMICNFRGVVLCAKCQIKLGVSAEGARFSTSTPTIGVEAVASPGEMPAAEETNPPTPATPDEPPPDGSVPPSGKTPA